MSDIVIPEHIRRAQLKNIDMGERLNASGIEWDHVGHLGDVFEAHLSWHHPNFRAWVKETPAKLEALGFTVVKFDEGSALFSWSSCNRDAVVYFTSLCK